MKKEGILGIVLMLLFLVMPVASAHIEIIDMGTVYDGADHYGYIDYQNVGDYNVSGTILVYIDNNIAAGEILDMSIRYLASFRCSPIKTLEFPLNETKGDHRIVAYVFYMNSSAERIYAYCAEDWWSPEPEDDEESEEVEEDWLKCWGVEE